MTSSTALAVFGSVDEISNIVSAADLSTAVLNLIFFHGKVFLLVTFSFYKAA